MSKNVNFFEGITSKKLKFLIALSDPDDQRTQGEIAKELDVRPETLSRWKKAQGFLDAIWSTALYHLEPELLTVMQILIGKAKAGDLPSARLLLEIAGKIGPQKKCTQFHYDLISMDDKAHTDELKDMYSDMTAGVKKRLIKFYNDIDGVMEENLDLIFDEISLIEDVQLAVA